jgi:hypothetical protein
VLPATQSVLQTIKKQQYTSEQHSYNFNFYQFASHSINLNIFVSIGLMMIRVGCNKTTPDQEADHKTWMYSRFQFSRQNELMCTVTNVVSFCFWMYEDHTNYKDDKFLLRINDSKNLKKDWYIFLSLSLNFSSLRTQKNIL